MSLKFDGVNNVIKDTNGNVAISIPATGSAVNYFLPRNAITGTGPSLEAAGADTNIDLLLTPKGTGQVRPGGPLVMASGITPSQGRFVKAMTDADYTSLAAEYCNRILEFTGTLGAGRNIILPTVAGAQWVVYNNTTGGFALTFKTAAGTGIAVAAGKRAIIYGDGTNIVRVTADT